MCNPLVVANKTIFVGECYDLRERGYSKFVSVTGVIEDLSTLSLVIGPVSSNLGNEDLH